MLQAYWTFLKKREHQEEHQDTVVMSEMWKLLKMDQWGIRRHLHHETDQPHLTWELPHPAEAEVEPEPKAQLGFVRRYRGKLIDNVLRLDTILDALQHERILTPANLDAINIYGDQRDKQRVLMDLMLLQKRDKAQEAFRKALVKSDPLVAAELNHQFQKQVCREDTKHPQTF